MQAAVTLSNEQATAIAAAILPAIRGYIDQHRDEYEAFLADWNAKKQVEGGQPCA